MPIILAHETITFQRIDTILGIIKYLAENCGADPRDQNDSPLIKATWSGNVQVVRYLVEKHGADPRVQNDKPLLFAFRSGSWEMVRYLMERGADIQNIKRRAIIAASRSGSQELFRYLVRNVAPSFYDDKYLGRVLTAAGKSNNTDLFWEVVEMGRSMDIPNFEKRIDMVLSYFDHLKEMTSEKFPPVLSP
mgnify:CR=1 FL=1